VTYTESHDSRDNADKDRQVKQQRFMDLLDPVHDRLARFAHALTRNRETARDLVQETLLIAYEHFDELKDESAFASWMFTIARRNFHKLNKRESFLEEYDENAAEKIEDTNIQPDVAMDIRILYDALARLPESQREAVVMFEISGLTLEEIHAIQGGSLSGVKSRIARGRRKLASLLGVEETSMVHATQSIQTTAPELIETKTISVTYV
jgi:RNA polymerase sigma-70 factor (ECF subfamily)